MSTSEFLDAHFTRTLASLMKVKGMSSDRRRETKDMDLIKIEHDKNREYQKLEHELLKNVGGRIAEIRKQKALTQDQLAGKLSINAKYIQRIEQGKENLSLRTLFKLSQALSVSSALLLLPPIEKRTSRAGRPSKISVDHYPSRVRPSPGDNSVVPLYSIRVSAGSPDHCQIAEIAEYIQLKERKLPSGVFAARIEGQSMEPLILDGSLVLFNSHIHDPAGKIVLAQLKPKKGPDDMAYYLIKQLKIDWQANQGRASAKLVSMHENHPAIEVDLSPEGDCRIVAEMMEVLMF